MDGFATDPLTRLRRVPQQSRSRVRVERILDTAAEQVVAHGVDAVGTRGIAEAAGVPVASLYQYFRDKDTILLALVERDLQDMSAAVMRAVEALPRVSVATLAQATLEAFVTAYRQRPAFLMVWLRGRTNPVIKQQCVEHNRRIAMAVFEHGADLGLFADDAAPCHAEIAIEAGDRLLEKAFADDMEGDPLILAEAQKVVTAYLELYATPAGLAGVEMPKPAASN